MSQLDRFFDDALAGFDDDDDGFPQVNSTVNNVPVSAPPAAASIGFAPTYVSQQSSHSSHEQAGSSQASSSAQPAPAAAVAQDSQAKGLPSLQFDPLRRRKKAKPAANGEASAAGSSDAARPALTPQVQQLQEDLAKLVSEWSQAMHPEADLDDAGAAATAAAAAKQQRGGTSVLAALAEQTQRTVQQQSGMRPPPAGPAAAAAAAAGGGGGEMNAIVDVVMQHLLSRDVLYQPMKEIMDKYPPWLERQAAAAAAGSSSGGLSAEDLERYKAQYDCITRLVAAYESEPDNTAKIMDLLQQMQACGEPPAEIVQEMSSAIAADLPAGVGGHGAEGSNPAAGMDFEGLDFGDVDLEALPQELKNCPVQ